MRDKRGYHPESSKYHTFSYDVFGRPDRSASRAWEQLRVVRLPYWSSPFGKKTRHGGTGA